MGHQKTEGLDHRVPLLHVVVLVFVDILGEELSVCAQLLDVQEDIRDVLRCDSPVTVLLHQKCGSLLLRLSLVDKSDRVVGGFICDMNAAAEHVEHDIVSV